jgi:cysteine desulfurase
MAMLGVARAAAGAAKHVITTAIEHPAVLGLAPNWREGVAVTRLRVGSDGVVDPDDVRRALRPDTVLVSVMHANNELGTIQPVAEIARIAGGRRSAARGWRAGAGQDPGGCRGAGRRSLQRERPQALRAQGRGRAVRAQGHALAPIAFGGHHERDRRPGTENVPGIAAFGAAAEVAGRNLAEEAERLAMLRDRLENAVLDRISGVTVNGSRWNRTPNTSNMYFDGIDGEAMVIALDLRGFAVSTGAACSSGAVAPLARAHGHRPSADRARASMRFSLGRGNTAEQVDALVEALEGAVAHLRRISVHA